MSKWTLIVGRSLRRTSCSLDLLGLEADLLRREGRLALRAIRAEEATILSTRQRLRAAAAGARVAAEEEMITASLCEGAR